MRRILSHILVLSAALFCLSLTAQAQYSTFIVDDNGNPATTYPNLAQAIATASTYAGGPHKIIIEPGIYPDADLAGLNPAKIGEITGDPDSLAETIKFISPSGVHIFLTVPNNLKIGHFSVIGYKNVGLYLNGTQSAIVDGILFDGGGQGIYGNAGAGNTLIQNCVFYKNTSFGVWLDAGSALNLIQMNCFIGNNGGGVNPQARDDGNTTDVWNNNYFDNQIFAMAGGAGEVDANPRPFAISATASASSYNLGDTIAVDFNWDLPGCGDLDSLKIAAFTFAANYNSAKLQLVSGSADVDHAFFGAAPPALYTAPDVGTPGQIVFGAANFTEPHLFGGRVAYAKFVVIAANTSSSISTTGIDVRDPANNVINASGVPKSFTLVDNVAPVLDAALPNKPAGDDTYSDGSPVGGDMKLLVTLISHDNWDLSNYQYCSDSGAWVDWVAVGGPHPDAKDTIVGLWYNFGPTGLNLPEGRHIAEFRVKDVSNKLSNVIKYVYYIDYTQPGVPIVTLAGNCALDNSRFTKDSLISVTIAADPTATQMMLSESGDKPIVALASPTTFKLSVAYANPHTVYVRLYDKYNNRRDWTASSNTLLLDQVAPVAVGPLAISGAPKTATRNVTVTLSDFGNGGWIGEYNISQQAADLVCGNAGWKPIIPANYPIAFQLSNGDAMKHLYLASRDSAGNISNILTDSIQLDQTAPVLNTYTLTSLTGGSCTPDGSVKAVYSWTGSDAAKLQYSYDSLAWGDWKVLTGLPSPDSTTGSVPNVAGVQKLYIRILDDVGNISNPKLGTVTVDNTAPTLGGAVCLDAAATATPDPTYVGATNNTTFNIHLTGVSTNVVKVAVSQDLGVTWAEFSGTPTAGVIDLSYSWVGTPASCSWLPVQVKVKNCAGTFSGVMAPLVYFDLVGPTVTGLTGPALTNTLSVNLTITAADINLCGLYQMRLADGPSAAATNGVSWMSYNPTTTFPLLPGDGNHTVWLDVADYGGNIATKSVVIKVDMTPPTGSMVLTSSNPLAAPEWTDSQSGLTAALTWSPDTRYMAIRSHDGSNNTGWMEPPVSPFPITWTISGPIGLDTVEYIFMDSAGNTGGWYYAGTHYDPNAPSQPSAAIGKPLNSTELKWTAVPEGQKYYIRYNFQNQYPLYGDPIPPHPNNRLTEGIFAAEVADTFYSFPGPHPDIYSFSIWTLGKNGLYSLLSNQDVTATNYVLGDFSPTPDGCLDFGAEFGALAVSYNSILGDPNFNDSLDIGPTHNTKAWGYPLTDSKVDFEDLVIFALNYDVFHCGSAAEQNRPTDHPSAAGTMPIAVEVTVPSNVSSNDEIVIPVKVDNYSEIKGYHVVLDYNTDLFDLVRVEPGDAYKSLAQSFFYYDRKAKSIDVSGVVLGAGISFQNGEFFRAVLHAKGTGAVNISEGQLTFRDRDNSNIAASLGVVTTQTLPTQFALSQNYPNPFNPTTTIKLSLPVASDYKLTVFNVLGQVVKTFAGHSEAGYVTVDWNAGSCSSGIYLYRLEAGSYTATRKMVLLK